MHLAHVPRKDLNLTPAPRPVIEQFVRDRLL
jgi:hypothetical protein